MKPALDYSKIHQQMKNNLLSFLCFLCLFCMAKAQYTTHPIVHIGYAYQNQSFAEWGGRLLFLKKDEVAFRIGAAALMGQTQEKFAIMPKIQGDILLNFEKNVDIHHSYYALLGAETTNMYFAPKLGVNILGVIDVAAGYAFPYSHQTLHGKQLKGFNFNFTLNIPWVVIQDLTKK
mgnify:CR=1 FL=1